MLVRFGWQAENKLFKGKFKFRLMMNMAKIFHVFCFGIVEEGISHSAKNPIGTPRKCHLNVEGNNSFSKSMKVFWIHS